MIINKTVKVIFQLTMIVINFQIIVLICNLKEKKVKKVKEKKINITKQIQIIKFNAKNLKLTINELKDIKKCIFKSFKR